MNEKNPGHGHFKRLRDRYIKSGIGGFADYEIVELLFTLGGRRDDCKPVAKEAIKRFKTLRGVLEASTEDLQKIKGVGPYSAFGVKLVQEVARKFLKEKIIKQPVQNSSQEVFEYLYHSMRGLKKEIFKVLFLDSQNRILETVDLAEGTINAAYISPREVIENAIKHSAVSLIFAHNHPSGNPAPSFSDKELTRELVFAANVMKLKVLDHIIIGDNVYFSFNGEGLIEQYETDFANRINDLRFKI